ncbi:purine-binding taxis protein CheW [Natrialba magadii ATCC 43099]|uniref:CheW protein n=1 Tax=Natrialba magadii (strain ATCC 43099 / DSM 3394 / CCM 3739 / CIP 104546 / IAM 13178 / JCM 8861 / NBRC 102185 / NCIMB 2190 / MS3) TaxID=547559 RepID=D3SRT0_NATMM|nr:chemotaxis protein CheW [Natrialba magadii]ADD06704.1 purine-binding taxis protein CheW [Natrialba magadii ATCC 43099]ELY31835.1 CheW protein [Natrialba magadii ATCC 43099]
MAPELPEKVLGIDINKGDDRSRQSRSEREAEEEDRVRFVFFSVGSHRLAAPVDDVRTTTELPADVTAVPRSPEAIEGVTDLRGEITAVIDPTVHFPTEQTAVDREQLLVFDRNADDQAAAIRVTDVYGVDAIPESDVYDSESIEESVFDGGALEHPLVSALVKRERAAASESEGGGGPRRDGSTGSAIGSRDDQATERGLERPSGAVIEAVDAASADPASTAGSETGSDAMTSRKGAGTATPRPVVEATPIIDVEAMLLASGQVETRVPVLDR